MRLDRCAVEPPSSTSPEPLIHRPLGCLGEQHPSGKRVCAHSQNPRLLERPGASSTTPRTAARRPPSGTRRRSSPRPRAATFGARSNQCRAAVSRPNRRRIRVPPDTTNRLPDSHRGEPAGRLLALDLFVVVVGVDPRWLLHSLRDQYRTTLTAPSPDGGTPRTAEGVSSETFRGQGCADCCPSVHQPDEMHLSLI
jgi:hypothetical protein